ncbi:MAG: TonB-dependent receptor [Candidatus Eisenbacteria bacterium]|nr:TonB-dependent receptor [Candidatus Eisenbacteria bacterium]
MLSTRPRIARRRHPDVRPGRRLAFAFALGVALSSSAAAGDFQDLSGISLESLLAEPVVETMTTSAQRAGDVPGTVFAWTGEELRARGVTTVDEALEAALGVEVVQGLDRSLFYFRDIRDDLNSKVLFLLDGVPINDPATGGFIAALNFPIANLRQLEVVVGPGSAIYGANAFSGVINVRTTRPRERKGWEVGLVTGGEPLQSGVSRGMTSIAYAAPVGSAAYRVSAHVGAQGGTDLVNRRENPSALRLPADGHAGMKAGRIEGQLEYKKTWVQVSYHDFSAQAQGLPTLPTPRDRRVGGLLLGTVEQEFLGDASHRLVGRLALQRYHMDPDLWSPAFGAVDEAFLARSPVPLLIDTRGGIVVYEFEPTDRLYHEIDFTGNRVPGGRTLDPRGIRYRVGGDDLSNHTFTANEIDRAFLQLRGQRAWGAAGSATVGLELDLNRTRSERMGEFHESMVTAFGQLDRSVGPLRLLASGRIDRIDPLGTIVSPRMALTAQPLPALRAKISYSRAYRAPTLIERYSNYEYYGAQVHGSPDLEAEELQGTDASLDYTFEGGLRFKVTRFDYAVDNAIESVPTSGAGGIFYQHLPTKEEYSGLLLAQVGERVDYFNESTRGFRRGWEVTADWAARRGAKAQIGYSLVSVDRAVPFVDRSAKLRDDFDRQTLQVHLDLPVRGTAVWTTLRLGNEVTDTVARLVNEALGLAIDERPLYDNWRHAQVQCGLRHRLGDLSVSLVGRNLLGSDRRIFNLAGYQLNPSATPVRYDVDEKPYCTLAVTWND